MPRTYASPHKTRPPPVVPPTYRPGTEDANAAIVRAVVDPHELAELRFATAMVPWTRRFAPIENNEFAVRKWFTGIATIARANNLNPYLAEGIARNIWARIKAGE